MLIIPAIIAVFGISMLMAAWSDLTTYKIPNWISLVMIAGFLCLSPFMGLSWVEFGQHIALFAACLAIMMLIYAFGVFGGGDAKFFAATSIWWAPGDLFLYTVYTVFAGGALAVILVVSRRMLPAHVLTTGWMHTLLRDEKKMPYGLALSFAGLVTLPMSQIYLGLLG